MSKTLWNISLALLLSATALSAENLSYPDLKLGAGENKLRIFVTGKSPESNGLWAGFDYLHLK